MKRFTTILFLTFSRWGLLAFTIYYTMLCIIILNIFPVDLMYTIAKWIDPYYVAIRYVSIIVNVFICIVVFRFFMKYIQFHSYIIRKKTLSFIVAASIVQLMSFFCYTNLPVAELTNTNQLANLNSLFVTYNFHIVEFIALFFTGYVLAFYISTLARVKFLTDVVLAPKRNVK